MKILILENQAQVISALRNVLVEMGHQVSVVSSVERGKLRAQAFRFDMLISNGDTGDDQLFSLYKFLLKTYNMETMPVLYLFNSNFSIGKELQSLPNADFIRLPFDEVEFRIRWNSLQSRLVQKVEEKPIEGRVLIVEDNPINQKVLGMQVAKVGLEYDSASDGQEAVDKCLKTEYAYVLMDIFMPGMDGPDATRLIRKNEEGKEHHARIIAISANESKESEKMCLDSGMDEYLVKPFSLDALKQKMR